MLAVGAAGIFVASLFPFDVSNYSISLALVDGSIETET